MSDSGHLSKHERDVDRSGSLIALRELAEKLAARDTTRGPWTWQGGYPQRVVGYGSAALIAEVFENPDVAAEVAPFLALCDPRTILGLLDRIEELQATQPVEVRGGILRHFRPLGRRELYDHIAQETS